LFLQLSGHQFSGYSDFLFCFQGILVGFLEVKVFFYKNYFPQVAITNLSLSAGVNGSWEPSVLDRPRASHLVGAMWNGFDIFRCQTIGCNKLTTDKQPVTAESSLDALHQMLEQCRDSLSARLAALTLDPDKDNGGTGKRQGEGGGDKNEGTYGGKGKGQGSKDKGNGGTGDDNGIKGIDSSQTSASKTRKAFQPVSLSTLNILLQNLEQAGDDFNRHF
jgi:hypothetical protein